VVTPHLILPFALLWGEPEGLDFVMVALVLYVWAKYLALPGCVTDLTFLFFYT
jgi:hypothetical protein